MYDLANCYMHSHSTCPGVLQTVMERISDQPTDSEARTDSEPESSSLSISHNAGASFTNEIPMSVECTETSQAAALLPQSSTTESNSGQPAQLQHQCNEDVLSG